ncbi:hypothetical protein DL93DRAFT_1679667 [Clavulina sp. PMI_390]|nr:hypothetical protein DL93DRAFT_1679667 [Clavulina sp. PMI_390]
MQVMVDRPTLYDHQIVVKVAERLEKHSQDDRDSFWWQSLYYSHAKLFIEILCDLPAVHESTNGDLKFPNDFAILLWHVFQERDHPEPGDGILHCVEGLVKSELGKHRELHEWMALYWREGKIFNQLREAAKLIATYSR